ncbi:MAG: DUF3445 domain-containing protein [Gammaproteobacteria bacterium]
MSVVEYYPFNGSKDRLRLGLSLIPASEWIQYEDDFSDRILEKKYLIREQHNRVIQCVDGSAAAQNELLQNIVSYISKYKEDIFTVTEKTVNSHADNHEYEFSKYESNPLELVSYLVPDDFCLLEKFNDDYRLIAASVCNPTYWELSEKVGHPLKNIHSPIPNLENKIGRMIRHFFANLKVDDYFQRANWFLMTTPELPLFKDSFNQSSETENLNIDNIGEKLFLRSERQSFRKLPKTENIAFGIKIYVAPLNIVKQYSAIAEDLIIAINTMSVEQKQLLGINSYENLLEEYLHKVLLN